MRLLFSSLFKYPTKLITSNHPNYDDYWKQKRGANPTFLSKFQLERAKVVASLIEEQSTVLDIGAGNCAILSWLIANKDIKAQAVDCSTFSKACAKKANIPFIEVDIDAKQSLGKLPEADYIIALELLEHLATPEELLNTLLEKCNKGLIFSVPNTGYFIHRLRLLFGRFPSQWLLHPGEHLRFWTASDMRWWLQAMKIEEKQSRIIFYEGNSILRSLLPSLFAKAMVVIIRKVSN